MTATLHEDILCIYHVLLNSSQNEKCFRQKLRRKSKRYMCTRVRPPGESIRIE